MVHGVCDFSYSFSACPDMKNRRLRVGVEVPTGKAVDRRGEINLCLAWQLERGIRGLLWEWNPQFQNGSVCAFSCYNRSRRCSWW